MLCDFAFDLLGRERELILENNTLTKIWKNDGAVIAVHPGDHQHPWDLQSYYLLSIQCVQAYWPFGKYILPKCVNHRRL